MFLKSLLGCSIEILREKSSNLGLTIDNFDFKPGVIEIFGKKQFSKEESFKLIPETSAPRAPDSILISIRTNLILDLYFVKMYKQQ